MTVVDDAALGRVVLLTEHALTAADAGRTLAELRALVPVDQLDQHDAVARDLHTAMDRTLAASGRVVHQGDGADLPGGLLLGMIATVVGWRAGRGECCQHTADPRTAQPIMVAAWRPGLVACATCPHLFSLRRGSHADRECDACGRVVEGPEHDDGVFPGVVVAGSVTFLVGLCGDCQHQTKRREAA